MTLFLCPIPNPSVARRSVLQHVLRKYLRIVECARPICHPPGRGGHGEPRLTDRRISFGSRRSQSSLYLSQSTYRDSPMPYAAGPGMVYSMQSVLAVRPTATRLCYCSFTATVLQSEMDPPPRRAGSVVSPSL
jgi:hypothetical protein